MASVSFSASPNQSRVEEPIYEETARSLKRKASQGISSEAAKKQKTDIQSVQWSIPTDLLLQIFHECIEQICQVAQVSKLWNKIVCALPCKPVEENEYVVVFEAANERFRIARVKNVQNDCPTIGICLLGSKKLEIPCKPLNGPSVSREMQILPYAVIAKAVINEPTQKFLHRIQSSRDRDNVAILGLLSGIQKLIKLAPQSENSFKPAPGMLIVAQQLGVKDSLKDTLCSLTWAITALDWTRHYILSGKAQQGIEWNGLLRGYQTIEEWNTKVLEPAINQLDERLERIAEVITIERKI